MELKEAAGLVKDSTTEVFETMLQLNLEARSEFEDPKPMMPNEVTAVVGLTGEQSGAVGIGCTCKVAKLFVARMLGMEPEEIEDASEITDGMGEIGNMIAGNVKRLMLPVNMNLSLPIVAISPDKGCGATIRTPGQQGYGVRFEVKESADVFCVELSLAES